MNLRGTVINFEDAGAEVQQLAVASAQAREAAYAPFSGFRVGAALRTPDGQFVGGCNVENSTYGATICAERTACTKAVSQGTPTFTAIAICADKIDSAFTTPCGICRQFLFEFAPTLPVYCVSSDLKQILVTSLEELLPYGFRLNPSRSSHQVRAQL